MGLLRPATPGFLVTLIATALLAVVTFNVPILKSIYFLKASVTTNNVDESVLFGTLGYCLDVSNNQTCSKPAVGYELDVNALLGDDTVLQIPQVVVKWVTYALVLHPVALVLAAISAVFGLLAHVREMSMTYCSTCVSGFAAAVALIAFIFDLVLFFLTKSRINSVDGGKAEIGMSIWLTLAAWLLLFFAGCFYGLGRCCIRRRPRGPDREAMAGGGHRDDGYAEQMRLEAVKAEADRKARQAAGKNEIGLPVFSEFERQPLTSKTDETYIEDGDSIVPYHAQAPTGGAGVGAGTAAYNRNQQQPQFAGGYAQAAPGSRSVDAYYNASPVQTPARQGSQYTQHTQAPSTYSESYTLPAGAAPVAAAGAAGAAAGYLTAHNQQPSAAAYGHGAYGTSYHSAVSQQDNNYGQGNMVDPFAAHPPQNTFSPDTYNAAGYMYTGQQSSSPPPNGGSNTNPYRATQASYGQPERSYTLGGGGYGDNVVPGMTSYPQYGAASPAPSGSVYTTSSAPSIAPPHINTSVTPPAFPQPSSPRGPRDPTPPMPGPVMGSTIHETHDEYADSPPMYDAATAQPPGQWGAKH